MLEHTETITWHQVTVPQYSGHKSQNSYFLNLLAQNKNKSIRSFLMLKKVFIYFFIYYIYFCCSCHSLSASSISVVIVVDLCTRTDDKTLAKMPAVSYQHVQSVLKSSALFIISKYSVETSDIHHAQLVVNVCKFTSNLIVTFVNLWVI